MKNISLVCMICLLLVSCGKKKEQTEDIIVEKVVEKPQASVSRMPDLNLDGTTKWVGGAMYSYELHRTSNDSLRQVENHGVKYHDNEVKLTVRRSNGSVFFQKTFTKSNFANVLPSSFKESGVLLGVNFDKVDGNNMLFVASVGSPDDTMEEFYNVLLVLDNFGATRAEECKIPEEVE